MSNSRFRSFSAARARSFSTAPEVDVVYRCFIPSPLIEGAPGVFGGDNRSFSYDGGTHRGMLHAKVQMRGPGVAPSIRLLHRSWGETTQYSEGDAVAVAGKPDWWKDKASGASPIARKTLKADDGNLKLELGAPGSAREIEATISDATVATIYVVGGNPLVTLAPAIDATLTLMLKVEGGHLKARLDGSHDGFPAHEVYVNQRLVHSYDPVAAGNGPSSLFPPEDISVDTGWVDFGPAGATLGVRRPHAEVIPPVSAAQALALGLSRPRPPELRPAAFSPGVMARSAAAEAVSRPMAKAQAAARSFAAAGQAEILFRMFIPAPLISGPVGVFGGDGRGPAYDAASYRGMVRAVVRLGRPGVPRDFVSVQRKWGESTEYAADDALDAPGRPDWWKEKREGATPTRRQALPVTEDNLNIEFGSSSTRKSIEAGTLDADLLTITAAGNLPLAKGSPDIDAELSIFLWIDGGELKTKVEGSHDGFPAYELYVNGTPVYTYDPVAADESPTALFPPMDVDVETGWRNLGTVTTQALRANLAGALEGTSAVDVADLGVSVISAISGNAGDISWQLKQLEGYYHPKHDTWTADQQRSHAKPEFKTYKFKAEAVMETAAVGDMWATFPVSYQGNGHYIANLTIEPPDEMNDVWMWDLSIETTLRRDAVSHTRGGRSDVASLELVFTFHFSSPIHDSNICKLTYRLFATGEVQRDVRWTQRASY